MPRAHHRLIDGLQIDIGERRLPQDGRIRLPVGGERHLDLRVSTLPTLFGEKVVIRVLDARSGQLDLLEPPDLRALIDKCAAATHTQPNKE